MADPTISAAISAYRNAAQIGGKAGMSGGDAMAGISLDGNAGKATVPSFPELLSQSIDTSIKSNQRGEQVSVKSLVGKAHLHEMVTAVTNAELTLQTVVAVRDKVISAYQDIMRMPI
jgi:flagellar hook-basal body complex protein FliE